jgi:hypothetical protein
MENKAYYAVSKHHQEFAVTDVVDGDIISGFVPKEWWAAALIEDWKDVDSMSDGWLFDNFELVEAPIRVMEQQIQAESSAPH